MPRAPRSVVKRKRHKKWLDRAKGYRGRRNSVFKLAKEAVLKAGQYAYRDRRKKKAVFRQSWQVQINAAARPHNISYSQLTSKLKESKVIINRKMLAQIGHEHPAIFEAIIKKVTQK